MLRRLRYVTMAVLVVGVVSSPALGLITTDPRPLRTTMGDAEYIAVATVDKLLPERPALVLNIVEDLKGKLPVRRLPINAKGDKEAEKLGHIPLLMKRLAPGLPVILLVNHRGKIYNTFAYTNGTWFFLQGQQVGPDEVAWSLLHGEPYLRKVFSGSTQELRSVIVHALAGKAAPPELNHKETPGFGPEAAPQKSSRLRVIQPANGRGLFAVIPTITVGGPLAVLALLFPAVFGGVLVLFRQWLAFITVLSVNGTLLLVLWLWPQLLRGSWWSSSPALWSIITLVTLLGTLWAWRRQLAAAAALGPLVLESPRRTEYIVLTSIALFSAAVVGTTLWLAPPEASDLSWNLTLALTAGVWGGLLYKLYRDLRRSGPVLTTEGVMLGVTLGTCIVMGTLRWGHGATAEGRVEATVATAADSSVPQFIGKRWAFQPTGDSGLFVSSPLVEGDHIYAAAAHPSFKVGTLYCLERDTGKEAWNFIDDGLMKQMLSSPAMKYGRVYIGEGFHDDPSCKLYCIDAATGTKLWEFATTGQTESSPCVAKRKVYIGGGNDGLYCIDADNGTKLWLFGRDPGGRLLRFCAPPAVVDGRVYCGSGVDRNAKEDPGETALFCLDADTGKQLWKAPTTLPCWGAPVVKDRALYIGIGNGDVFNDADAPARPAGQVLCFDAATGQELWRHDLPNGVIGTVAVDAHQVYAGCRDGRVYCLGRHDGKQRWAAELGSPVIATPALAACPGYEATAHVFAIGSKGKVACLGPHTGALLWAYTLDTTEAHLSSSPRVVVSRTPEGDRRQIIFGAGIGGLTTGRPVVYCLEDLVKIE